MKIGTTGKPLTLFIIVEDEAISLFTLNTIANPSMKLSEVEPHLEELERFGVDKTMAAEWINGAFQDVKKLRSFK